MSDEEDERLNSADTSLSSSFDADELAAHHRNDSALRRVHAKLTLNRFRAAWLCLFIWEGLLVAGCIVFFVANLFPITYLVLVGGVFITTCPFACMRLCTTPRKGLPRYGTKPWGPKTGLSPELRREQTCRWLVTRIGAVMVPLNLLLMIFVAYLWWAPYAVTGLANISTLCVAGLGHVSTTTARVVVRCPTATEVRVLAWPHAKSKSSGAVFSDWVEVTPAVVSSAVVVLTELAPATSYRWVVEYESEHPIAPASGSLRTQPLLGTREASKFRFTFGSCLLRDSLSPFDSLAEISRQNSSFMVFLGDVIYIDQPNPEIVGPWRFAYEAKYVSNFDDPYMREMRLNMPWVQMYDDHEVRNDWSSGEDQLFDVAIHDVWYNLLGKGNPPSMRAPSTVKGVLRPEYHFTFRYGEACFIVLDVRRHRSNNAMPPDDPSKTMLGAGQLADLLTWLNESSAASAQCTVKFICTPVPMTATAASHDTWTAFPRERQLILDYVDAQGITGVVFLSGDRHTAGVIQLQGSMIEASVSTMDAFWSTFPSFGTPYPNETVLSEHMSRDYWGTVDVDTSDSKKGRVTLSIDAQDGKRAFTKTIEMPKAT